MQVALEEILTPTCWLDAADGAADSHPVTVSFSGRRLDVKGKPRQGDRFVCEQTVEGVIPGSGPIAVTAEVRGMNPGTWEVTAAPVRRAGSARRLKVLGPGRNAEDGRPRPSLPWRPKVEPAGQPQVVATAQLAFSHIPGIRRLVWGPLVLLGVVVGLVVQALLLARAGRDAGAALALSGLAVLGGWIGAKAWYVAVHRGRRFDGWCIQGAILGGALVAAALPVVRPDFSLGVFLNATAPGLMLGLAVGKQGCIWAGCCTGRPTRSRWGIWSSDRQLGIRRIPAQLLESLLGLTIGLTALAVVLTVGLGNSGELLLGTVAAYTLGRQFILPLRAEPRQTSLGRPLVIVLATMALVTAAAVALAGS